MNRAVDEARVAVTMALDGASEVLDEIAVEFMSAHDRAAAMLEAARLRVDLAHVEQLERIALVLEKLERRLAR
jgi:hypothetical protein